MTRHPHQPLDTIIVAEDGRKVSHLKRWPKDRLTPKGQPTRISVWYDGGLYYPTKRSAHSNNDPFPLRGAKVYTDRVAKSWLKSLTRAGLIGFRLEKVKA